jgi:serine/threonine-protein kinase
MGPSGIDAGWTRVGGGAVRAKEQRFPLENGRAYRYYLVWITKLPADKGSVQISEIALLAPKPAP